MHLDDKEKGEYRQWRTRPSLKSQKQRQIERQQAQLPILGVKDEFCRRLENERILIVKAETGSGKSTQLPQYAAEYFKGLVVCTQPRVIAAVSLARRVAEEYDGTSVGQSVGYRVGHSSMGKDKNRVPGTDIIFMTDGTLIQESQNDPLLSNIEVLIIDEAHERSLNTDIAIGIAKRLLTIRPNDFYVVISSATINTDKFLNYFERTEAQLLKVPGRVYQVDVDYFSKSKKSKDPIEKSAVDVLQHIYDQHQGHTLVFLPGQREIENAMELFKRDIPEHCFAFPLYSALTLEEQDLVLKFDEGPQNENRMVVFCTNIAETSLTIKNVRLIIDSGLAHEPYFDHDNRVTVVQTVRISRASAEQRKGRAGRTASGYCVRLYEEDELVNNDTIPTILRSSLDLVVLQLVRLGLNIQEFHFMDRPDEKHLQISLNVLKDLACIDTEQNITPKGELFAKLGIDPRFSAFLLDTYLEHESIRELVTTMTAILIAPGSIFAVTGETKEDKEYCRDRIFNNARKFDSDLFYFVSVYKNWSSQGAINSDDFICQTCRKTYKNSYVCGPCRAAYSTTHLLNNKILNYVEGMSEELTTTITDPCWKLDPRTLENANESTIIGNNLLKYFPERYGRLVQSRADKRDARMVQKGFPARISDTSALFQRKTDNLYFIAMSVVKLPGGLYSIDRLHPICLPPSSAEESDEASDEASDD
jgi:HrpA-like RNA helicase